MGKDFFEILFGLLQIPKDKADEFHKDFEEILSLNLSTSLVNNLPADKKESFAQFAKSGSLDKESINQWLSEQKIDQDKDLVNQLNTASEKSYDDFFAVLIEDLDEGKKREVADFARSYLNG